MFSKIDDNDPNITHTQTNSTTKLSFRFPIIKKA